MIQKSQIIRRRRLRAMVARNVFSGPVMMVIHAFMFAFIISMLIQQR